MDQIKYSRAIIVVGLQWSCGNCRLIPKGWLVADNNPRKIFLPVFVTLSCNPFGVKGEATSTIGIPRDIPV